MTKVNKLTAFPFPPNPFQRWILQRRKPMPLSVIPSVTNQFTHVAADVTVFFMIRSFRHKGLEKLFMEDKAGGVRSDLVKRCRNRLTALHAVERLEDLNVPGFDFHGLQGKPKRYSIHVNGPWCITFEWIEADAWRVELEQYH